MAEEFVVLVIFLNILVVNIRIILIHENVDNIQIKIKIASTL